MTTPTGAPCWTRQTSHTDYGGHLQKRNYMGLGVVSALTDVGAEDFCRICSDLAAVARTAAMFVLTYTCRDTSPAAPTVSVVCGMTGVQLVSYEGGAPPTGYPSAARNGNGDVTFTFEATYDDDYGVEGAWAPVTCNTSVSATAAREAVWVISGSTVRVRVFDAAGAAVSDPVVTLEVG
jgi:phage tail tape-measure protein